MHAARHTGCIQATPRGALHLEAHQGVAGAALLRRASELRGIVRCKGNVVVPVEAQQAVLWAWRVEQHWQHSAHLCLDGGRPLGQQQRLCHRSSPRLPLLHERIPWL